VAPPVPKVEAKPAVVPQVEPPRTPIKSPILRPKPRVDPLRWRRTLIPILLTLGLLLTVLGGMQWLSDPDEPFSAVNMRWSAMAMPPLGLALVATAVWNMAYVRRQLISSHRR
jgi:hypothetical protein